MRFSLGRTVGEDCTWFLAGNFRLHTQSNILSTCVPRRQCEKSLACRRKHGAAMMYWIYDYPSWIIGPLFVATFIAVTWIGIFLTRATVHGWLHRDEHANEMVGSALSNYFVLFGILLGLLAVATYQNYATVGDIVDKEASSLSALYRDVSAFPQPIRSQLQNALREYARYTIQEGWEQQRKGIRPTGEPERSTMIARTVLAFEPSTETEKIIDVETLRQSAHRAFTLCRRQDRDHRGWG